MNELISTIVWVLGGAGWFVSNVITYKLGKRAKIDDVKIQKVYEYAEGLAVALQKDHHDREYLVEWYKDSFGHLPTVDAAVAEFESLQTLYQSARMIMGELPQHRQEIADLKRKSAIYLDKELLDLIAKYVETTNFKYITDGGVGFLNT